MTEKTEQVLEVHKVSALTVYKLFFYGLILSFIPLGVVMGIAGFFDLTTVKWNGQPVHGVTALAAGPTSAAISALIFTIALGSLANLGLWLLSRFHMISIKVVLRGDSSQ